MDFSAFHFARPFWLFSGFAIPVIGVLYLLFSKHRVSARRLETFIDKHLIPHLLLNAAGKNTRKWLPYALWALVWCSLTIAVAGPRWDFIEIETLSSDQSLVVLLDLSQSMNAADVKPSRLIRAKQKIEDLINRSQGVSIGLIAFAADPHMITPLTEDKETIRHLLPSLNTELVYIQGSRLTPALDMAANMLKAEPGSNKAILLISDGGFEDISAISQARELAKKGVVIHTMGVGTAKGAPVQDKTGNFIKKNNTLVLSKLEEAKLREISRSGKGHYLTADFSRHSETVILQALANKAKAQEATGTTTRIWEERFYLFLLPVLPILLVWFRKGYVLGLVLLCLGLPSTALESKNFQDYFKNSEQQGLHALESADPENAIKLFSDPYRKGVAHYRAQHFAEAELFFRQSTRKEVEEEAKYNLGNSLAQQMKLKEAITAYEEVLKRWPENKKAKDNLEIVKKMLEEEEKKEEQEESQPSSNESENNDEEQDEADESDSEQQKGSEKNQDNPQNEHADEEKKGKDSDQNEDVQDGQQGQDNDQNEDVQEDAEQRSAPQADEEQALHQAQSDMHQDADLWLNQITQDPQQFLKNKFLIESKLNGTEEGIDPW